MVTSTGAHDCRWPRDLQLYGLLLRALAVLWSKVNHQRQRSKLEQKMNILRNSRLTSTRINGIVAHSAALCGKVMEAMSSKNRITVNLSDDEYQALGELAERSKVSKAWLGRHAISSLLERADKDGQQLPLPLTGLKRKGSQ